MLHVEDVFKQKDVLIYYYYYYFWVVVRANWLKCIYVCVVFMLNWTWIEITSGCFHCIAHTYQWGSNSYQVGILIPTFSLKIIQKLAN